MEDAGYEFVKLSSDLASGPYEIVEMPWEINLNTTARMDQGSLRQHVFFAVKKASYSNSNPLASDGGRIVDGVEVYLTSLIRNANQAIDRANVDNFQLHNSSSNPNDGYGNAVLQDNPPDDLPPSPPSEHLHVHAAILRARHVFEALAQQEFNIIQGGSNWSHHDQNPLQFLNEALNRDRDYFDRGVIPDDNPGARLMQMYCEHYPSLQIYTPRSFLGVFTYWLIKYLCQQCRYCRDGFRGHFMELDHLLEFYRKSFNVSRMNSSDTTTHPCPYQLKHGYVLRAIYEALKTAMVCKFCHARDGQSRRDLNPREEAALTLEHEENLRILPRIRDPPLGGGEVNCFEQVFDYIEYPTLLLEWHKRGAFKTPRGVPVVTLATLGGVLHRLLGIDIRDVCTFQSEEDWQNAESTDRVQTMIKTVVNIAKKMSKRCYGCNKCFVNLGVHRYRGIETNHRKREDKRHCVSEIKNIVTLCKEVLRCDCDFLCKHCHRQVTQYQEGVRGRPRWYNFGPNGEPVNN